jgi:hypothetical protein
MGNENAYKNMIKTDIILGKVVFYMLEEQNSGTKRKYSWVGKWAKMTGERARIDAKVNNTYIVYEKNGKLVKEFPNGDVIPFNEHGES